MKPFILESAEFNHKEMEVVAQTDCGVFNFPVLPAYEGQKEQYITRFENGRYVIRTKDYDKLKAGDYGKGEEIKLVHEVCHYDKRVISPIYSTGEVIKIFVDIKKDILEKLEKAGLSWLLKAHNTVEDLYTIPVLKRLGYQHVEEVIQVEKHIINLGKLFSQDENFSTNFHSFLLSKTSIFDKRIRAVYAFYDVLDGLLIGSVVRRMRELSKIKRLLNKFKYHPYDWIANRYDIDKGRKMYSECLKHSLERVKTEKDPIMRYRWNLEVVRLEKSSRTYLPGLIWLDVAAWGQCMTKYIEELHEK